MLLYISISFYLGKLLFYYLSTIGIDNIYQTAWLMI